MGYCSRCGECCRWFVIITTADNLLQVKNNLKSESIKIVVDKKMDKDWLDYYTYRNIKTKHLSKNYYELEVPIKYPEETKIEVINRNTFRIIIRCICNKLENNLCTIFSSRPYICANKKDKGKNVSIWKPDCCTDK